MDVRQKDGACDTIELMTTFSKTPGKFILSYLSWYLTLLLHINAGCIPAGLPRVLYDIVS